MFKRPCHSVPPCLDISNRLFNFAQSRFQPMGIVPRKFLRFEFFPRIAQYTSARLHSFQFQNACRTL
nr:MAG TPA: hypothetical protein [Caudoviricetes sp.]